MSSKTYVTRLRNVHINNFYVVFFFALKSATSWKQDTKKKLMYLNPKVTVNNWRLQVCARQTDIAGWELKAESHSRNLDIYLMPKFSCNMFETHLNIIYI